MNKMAEQMIKILRQNEDYLIEEYSVPTFEAFCDDDYTGITFFKVGSDLVIFSYETSEDNSIPVDDFFTEMKEEGFLTPETWIPWSDNTRIDYDLTRIPLDKPEDLDQYLPEFMSSEEDDTEFDPKDLECYNELMSW